MAEVMRFAASNVQEGVVPDSGYWVMEENPNATITMVKAFLVRGKRPRAFLICSGQPVRREAKLDNHPFGHRTIFFRDPDGNVLEIFAGM